MARETRDDASGIAFMVAGSALLTLNDAIAKWLTDSYPVGQILFLRGLFTALPLVVFIWRGGGVRTLKVQSVRGQFLRAGLFVVSSTLFVYAVSLMPLPTVVALNFTAPLFITGLAPLLLNERVGWRRWAAVLGGFSGVVLIVRPFQADWSWVVLVPVLAAFSGALRDVATRHISATETSNAILFYSMFAVAAAGLLTYPFGWQPVGAFDTALLALQGIAVGSAHYCIIEAFRRAEAALIAPFKYSSMIWAVIVGYAVWGDLPDAWMIAGSTVILASGLYILHRERVTRRAKAVEAASTALPPA